MRVITKASSMTSRDFAYWLQGYFEIAKPSSVDADALAMIQAHLSMVFVHEIDPSHGGPEEQAKLNAIHNATGELTGMAKIQAHNIEAAKTGQPLMRC
jgi:hypothetical protein